MKYEAKIRKEAHEMRDEKLSEIDKIQNFDYEIDRTQPDNLKEELQRINDE